MTVKEKTGKLNLVRIEYDNFKKLNVSQDFPEDIKSVTVSGHNGAGKSSFIDGIFIALTGQDIPTNPIQVGKNEATIKAVIKDDDATYEAKLKFKQNGDTVKREFTLKVGEVLHKQKKARELLDQKLDSVLFDIFDFVNMQPRDKKTKLQQIFGLDFSILDGRKEALLADNRELDVKLTSYQDQINELNIPEDGKVYKHIDVSELAKELSEAKLHNKQIEGKICDVISSEENITAVEQVIKETQEEIDRLTTRLNNAQESLKEKLNNHKLLVAEVESLEKIELTPIQEKLDNVEANNQVVQKMNRFEELRVQVENIEAAKGQIKEKLKGVESERIAMIQDANLPKGLEITDKGVTFEGLALEEEQLSTAQLVHIGIQILCAMNPPLKIARIREASMLDSHTQKVIQEAVEKHGIIPFYEKVADGDLAVQLNEV